MMESYVIVKEVLPQPPVRATFDIIESLSHGEGRWARVSLHQRGGVYVIMEQYSLDQKTSSCGINTSALENSLHDIFSSTGDEARASAYDRAKIIARERANEREIDGEIREDILRPISYY